MEIAVVNAGSSTVKAALVTVGPDGARVSARDARAVAGDDDRVDAIAAALDEVGAHRRAVDAVSHRVVHGGRTFSEPTLIDAAVEQTIEDLSTLAPLHNPPALQGIRAAREIFPGQPMVAVFDTAFHSGRTRESMLYAIPPDLSESLGLLRYGFHGTAHASLVESLATSEGRDPDRITAVTLQLGSGCSACAVQGGRSIETSMGFSPLEGLVMGTRAGNIDASVVFELLGRGADVEEVRDLLTRRSGLAGLAGQSDMRLVLEAESRGDERASLAVAMFVRRIVTTVGSYWTLLDGEGALVFGGGIGTASAEIRRRVADGLGAWDVTLDATLNETGVPGLVSPNDSRPVYVFETDEERLLAVEADRVLRTGPS